MKKLGKRILAALAVAAMAGLIWYKGFYVRVSNQGNTPQDTEIGADVSSATAESIVRDMYDFPNRFAGTKSNARAGQYIRNFFYETGLEPYFEDGYYHSFDADSLKNSRYYMLNVEGTVENVAGKISGEDSGTAVVITAHMDSFLGKGALDNASGVAVLLETADRLAGEFGKGGYPADIVFVAFNAEECGMLGSQAFYEELSEDYSEFYNINLDCVGVAGKPLAVKNLEENSEKLYADFLPFLDRHQIPYKDILYAADGEGVPIGSSDHETFQEKGNAAMILGEADIWEIPNTRKDKRLDILDFSEMERLVDALEDFIVSADGKMY